MFNSILVVCTGNICRSPIGERLLRQALPDKTIDSAGVGALVDHEADSSAIAVAGQHQLSLQGHKARQFTGRLGRQYDLILVMEKHHIEQVTRIAPEARGKTLLIGHWLENKQIPDPYRQSMEAFEFVYQLLDQACQRWAGKLGG
ncbi:MULTISPECIES: protein tyrosine phosphatase [unclassified Tatumella]|uniref:arsenate reductase/protein-tyrosine-phosphatase family protein n=1 Tax=unclassified Tatumella TaxID=2649542 RepID=UPI001BB07AB2|nr:MULTISPECIES: protein tyrosine phosphatase [unclassified Tatumella]MBS0857083.1 protein tyrosine phosphatase [Tatumella sp. JGM16]MBS0913806.1 protein tyrosine phosphatase [Tatumella sp. JGM91]